jgi:hypothetical protein
MKRLHAPATSTAEGESLKQPTAVAWRAMRVVCVLLDVVVFEPLQVHQVLLPGNIRRVGVRAKGVPLVAFDQDLASLPDGAVRKPATLSSPSPDIRTCVQRALQDDECARVRELVPSNLGR